MGMQFIIDLFSLQNASIRDHQEKKYEVNFKRYKRSDSAYLFTIIIGV